MPVVSKEEIANARKMDLLSYLRAYEPGELVRFSGETYCTRTHDSLKISNGKWYWFSQNIGGRSALDYLVKVKEMSFPEAVKMLNGRLFSRYATRNRRLPRESCFCRYWTPIQAKQRRI